MSADETRSRVFPMLPATAWWQLRSRFQRAFPAQVDPQYVETVLGVSEKSARNLTPALRTLGLIDDNGKPTPLANEWRTDEGYPAACETMLEQVYPAALRDAVPPDDPDRAAAERWFMRERQVGQGAARQMASMYVLIAQRDPNGAENQRAPRSDRAGAERTSRESGGGARKSPAAVRRPQRSEDGTRSGQAPSSQTRQQPGAEHARHSVEPSLHIDVQVHVPADASPEQIDAIFSSMAKHLYQQTS